jgi:heme-degrading monooxygenase HmoA
MVHLLVEASVQDPAKWKTVFAGLEDFRKASGCIGSAAYHTQKDPNRIIILTEWKTVDDARKFGASAELKDAWKRAGVTSTPEVLFLDEVVHLPH